jgi:hypothetical protein
LEGQYQIKAIAQGLEFKVITIGHDPVVDIQDPDVKKMVDNAHSDFHLGEFYKNLPGLTDRAAQISFFLALMQQYPGSLYQIGQKTGGMDGATLLGIPTVYIEYGSNNKNARMCQWVKQMPFYKDVNINKPPSLLGKAILKLENSIRNLDPKSMDNNISSFWKGIKYPDKTLRWRLIALTHLFGPNFGLDGQDLKEIDGKDLEKAREWVNTFDNKGLQVLWKEWTQKMNKMKTTDLESCQTYRGYSEEDRTNITNVLRDMRDNYKNPDKGAIVRDPWGSYVTRKTLEKALSQKSQLA